MSNRNRNNNSNSNTRNSTATATVTPRNSSQASTRSSSTRQTQTAPAVTQTTVTQTPSTATQTTRRARKPVTIRVRSTGEEIRRVPVERSGYRVVRYEGRYHTVRGGGRTAPYIVGSEDGEDVLGRA